jgi:signaling intermediate in Toll pathway protein
MTSIASSNSQGLTARPSSYGHLIDKAKEHQALNRQEQFAVALKAYTSLEKYRRGHMKFIREGLLRMDEFNLQKDLLTYNRLIDMFPKGRFNNKTFFDSLWPKQHPQIDLALDILQKMEDNGIRPDYITYSLLCEIFGRVSFPVQKCTRIAVWFDKFDNIDPYRIEGQIPTDPLVLSKMALKRITGEDHELWEIMMPQSEEGPFVLAACNKEQVKFMESINVMDEMLHVEGPHRIWLQKQPLFYYSLCLIQHRGSNEINTYSDGMLSLGYFWDIIGLLLGYYWDIIGISLGYHWGIIGVSLGYTIID